MGKPTKDDMARLRAWVNYRDGDGWKCPDCSADNYHYNGGWYCNGCLAPIVCIVLSNGKAKARK